MFFMMMILPLFCEKHIDTLPPNWNQLFKHHDKASEDDLLSTPLVDANEGDTTVKVKVRFDHDETVIRPSDGPLLS